MLEVDIGQIDERLKGNVIGINSITELTEHLCCVRIVFGRCIV